MKIGYFVTHYPYEKDYGDYFCGGVGVVTENLAKEMVKRGHEILIFTTSRTRKYSFEEREDIKIHRYGADFRIAEAYMSFRLLFGPLRHEVDLVHTHMGNPPAPIGAMKYAIKKKKPFVITYHGDPQENFGNLIRRAAVSFYVRRYVQKILSAATIIICPSRYFIEESAFLSNHKNKIIVVPNGINLNCIYTDLTKEQCKKHFFFSPKDIILSFLGGLTSQKSPDVLIKAMTKVVTKQSDVKLLIGGIGPLEKKLKTMTSKQGMSESVKFCGLISKHLKPIFFGASDMFVFPSSMRGDLFPIVLLEASAAKLPLIVSDLPTLRCIVENGFNGLFVKRGSEDDLANVISHLLEDEEKRKIMGLNARKKVENYSWEKIAAETEKVYEEIL